MLGLAVPASASEQTNAFSVPLVTPPEGPSAGRPVCNRATRAESVSVTLRTCVKRAVPLPYFQRDASLGAPRPMARFHVASLGSDRCNITAVGSRTLPTW